MPIEHDSIEPEPLKPTARLTAFEGSPQKVELALQLAFGQMVPGHRGSPGWLRTIGLASFDGRKGLMLTFWEDQQALMTSRSSVGSLRERAAAAGISITEIVSLEVVFDEQDEEVK